MLATGLLAVMLSSVAVLPASGALSIRRAPENTTEEEHQYSGPDWGITSPDGGNMKDEHWLEEAATWKSYVFATLFVALIGSAPMVIQYCDEHPLSAMTRTTKIECGCLYVWLLGGLYLFTNVLYFQSPHFGGKVRSLNLEEAVYLFSQIITTVGYGDITPAKTRGQVFVGIFVIISFLVAAGMIAQLSDIIAESVKSKLGLDEDGHQKEGAELSPKDAIKTALKPVLRAALVFLFFVAIGVLFFSQYPGEKKTLSQGIYMSLITLSTVGFGAFTPVTKTGMVFGAFWMLFGVSALVSFVSSFTAFVLSIKAYERAYEVSHHDDALKVKA